MKLYAVCLIIVLLMGCKEDQKNDITDHKESSNTVTLWTSKTELFMEYLPLIVGKESRFAVHLTWLDTFTAVTEGRVALVFKSSGDGNAETAIADKPTSPGIFRPQVTFEKTGTYVLSIIVEGKFRDTLSVGEISVYSSLNDVPENNTKKEAEPTITFLKEQQWKTEFRTEAVKRRGMSGSVRAFGEIIPRFKSEVIIAAPFTGIIAFENSVSIPAPGAKVAVNTPLAMMTPSAETAAGEDNFTSRITEAETKRTLADREYKRAKELFGKGVISEKELQEAEADYLSTDAAYMSLSKSVAQTDAPANGDNARRSYDYVLRSPIAGTIVDASVVVGKQYKAGETLFRIINTSSVWVKANIPISDAGKLKNLKRATFRVDGFKKPFEIDERNGKLISFGSAVDEKTRTIPILFERANHDGQLRIGMFAEMYISTENESSVLAIPESALLEEEGQYSAFVQVEGEAFVKRDIVIGNRYAGYVEVVIGLREEERVVTTGAYQVRLASLSTQLPAHGHDH